ncbi:MAG: DNA primase [Phycisphaerales bacterium]|nr:MAG: DNA primase [Phycisphaerales bacterium]
MTCLQTSCVPVTRRWTGVTRRRADRVTARRDNTHAPGDDRDRVRDASDIVDVVGEHLSLRQKGREYLGVCPFHDDHKPSMYVVPDKQIFHCFSCGAGGDVFTFIQKYHSMDFVEALKFLAERAGIELTPRKRAPGGEGAGGEPGGEGEVSRGELAEACAFADGFFRAILRHPEHGAPARAVAERRGLTGEIAERFGIGAAPDRWDGLLMAIEKKGLPRRPFIAAGLLKQREGGDGCYDALRNRLIFPIRDQLGRAIAFGGRRINDEEEPKYLNSPESALFNKSATLYGLDLAARNFTKQKDRKRLIVVEGYTDAIACHRGGFDTAVATLGTALTAQHARVLRRYPDVSVILLFDGDEAGRRAADRAVEVFFAEPIDVRVATMTVAGGAKDPDELLAQADGRARFEAVLENAEEVLAWRFAQFREELSSRGVNGRAVLVERYLQRLSELGLGTLDPIRRKFVLEQLATITGLSWTDLTRLSPAGRKPKQRAEARLAEERALAAGSSTEPKPTSRRQTPAGGVVGALMAFPSLSGSLTPADVRVLGEAEAGATLAQVREVVLGLIDAGTPPELGRVLPGLEATSAQSSATSAARAVERAAEGDASRARAFFADCLRRLHADAAARARAEGEPADPLERLAELRAGGVSGGGGAGANGGAGVVRRAAYPRVADDGSR